MQEMETFELTAADMDEMMELEHKVCTPLIQASPDTIRVRLANGNIMLGVRMQGQLVGSIGFRYSTFSPDDLGSFPKTFGEFSTPPQKPTSFNAGFCYSVNVDPDCRTLAVQSGKAGLRATGVGKALIAGMQNRVLADGCTYLVGDGRPAFYNGSSDYPHERYEQLLDLKAILDRYATAGGKPAPEEEEALMAYPIFRAYNKALGGGLQIAWVIPAFFPGDTPAGGFRVVVYKKLR